MHNVQCTVYSVHSKHNNDDKSGKGMEVVMKYKGKGGYSAEGLEQRLTYVIKIMFMNYRVKDPNNFFYRYNLHNYINRS